MRLTAALAGITIGAGHAAAQGRGGSVTASWGAQATLELVATNLVPGGGGGDRSLTEARIVMPVGMLHAAALGGRVRVLAAAHLEKYTIPNGELAPGNWGESFTDRRHPHTLAHELMLVTSDLLGNVDGRVNLFLAVGKGFVPFGTDDPMSRPAVRFPVNHHLSQILERAVVLAGVRAGPATLEGAVFNGDEPVAPGSWPAWDRFGDSWAAQLTLVPLPGLEAQGSLALVQAPENRPGAGPDDRKASASARYERGPWYGQLEWARTATAGGAFVFHSLLAEAALTMPGHRPYVRIERSERPEEERVFGNPFRTRRPLFENSIFGITRWTVVTGGDAVEVLRNPLRGAPFVEVSWIGIARTGGGVFDPTVFYGRTQSASIAVGIRFAAGMRMHRMGRYQPAARHDMSAMSVP